ncbi:MAG: HD-GYP domain-containing protein [Thermodesulfobacteriota bacterium]
MVQDIFNNKLPSGITKGHFEKVKKTVRETMDFLSHREAISNIGKLISHDYKTYSHCVHVFTYTMALMHNHDFTQNEKIDVGIGALMHDLGKQQIPARILNKPGRLDAEEWILIKRHPAFGIGQCANLPLSHLTFKSIFFHHERFDGGGYPTGIDERNIPLPVRYLTCSDVYDAITSDRPYAEAETTFNALKIMRNNMQGAFDMDVFKELVTLLSNTRIA